MDVPNSSGIISRTIEKAPASSRAKEDLKIIATLASRNFVFDYATLYVSKHPTIPASSQFKLTDAEFNDFVKWLDGKDYSYKTKTEEALVKLKETAEKENYLDGIRKDYDVLEKAISHDKTQDLVKNKKEIIRLLQDEIVARYYFQRGRFQNQLADDDEVKEAISILSNSSKYQALLSK